MKKRWSEFRESARRKSERSHYGLAWSVWAASFLALALVLLGFGSTGSSPSGLIRSVAVVAIVVGFFFAYLTLSVARRKWPHEPPKQSVAFEELSDYQLQGEKLIRDWLSALGQTQVHHSLENLNALVKLCDDYVISMRNWILATDALVGTRLGGDAGTLYRLSPNTLAPRPRMVDEDIWGDIYPEVVGRTEWLKVWLREQLDL